MLFESQEPTTGEPKMSVFTFYFYLFCPPTLGFIGYVR